MPLSKPLCPQSLWLHKPLVIMSISRVRQVILYTRDGVLYCQKQENPFPGVFKWMRIWQFRQLWHLFDMVFMFIKLVNDHERPVDDSAVILWESTRIRENCKKTYYEVKAVIIQRVLTSSSKGLSGPRESQKNAFFRPLSWIHIFTLAKCVLYFGSYSICMIQHHVR